jgi:multimeric flavodoxin WrbA
MEEAGSSTKVIYASALDIRPCDCGTMHCWYGKPGQCVHRDEMEALYPLLAQADILVLATPVYIPLPGELQNLVNRLCPLVNPLLETREGRTRAQFRADVKIGRLALLSTGGWWERGNFATVVRIAEELSEDVSVPFAGAALRPHAFLMRTKDGLTSGGETVAAALRQAGRELVRFGSISDKTCAAVSAPLIGESELLDMYNNMAAAAGRRGFKESIPGP